MQDFFSDLGMLAMLTTQNMRHELMHDSFASTSKKKIKDNPRLLLFQNIVVESHVLTLC